MGEFDELWRAALLALVQAVTEFLPISSSGHLVLAGEVVGGEERSLTFDVGLHLGTMAAVTGYFWREWVRIGRSVLADAVREGPRPGRWSAHAQLGVAIVVATVPAVIVGFFARDLIEHRLREPAVVGTMLIAIAFVMAVLDQRRPATRQLLEICRRDAVTIGMAQALALVPGVSRSGVTIAIARGLGVARPAAARFSFLLSMPVVAGAGVLQATELLGSGDPIRWGPLIVGSTISALAGVLVIRWLLGFLESGTLWPFVWYRIGLGVLVLGAAASGAI